MTGILPRPTDNWGKIEGVKCVVLIFLILTGCGVTTEVNKTLEALDKTALATAKAERQLGDKGEIVLAGVAGVVSNLSDSTASISSILAGIEQRAPKTHESIDETLANVASLTRTTALISQSVQERVDDKKVYWLLYAIGAGVLLALLHSVFAAHKAKTRIRALHADVTHVKSKLPA